MWQNNSTFHMYTPSIQETNSETPQWMPVTEAIETSCAQCFLHYLSRICSNSL